MIMMVAELSPFHPQGQVLHRFEIHIAILKMRQERKPGRPPGFQCVVHQGIRLALLPLN
jgi:hypothetical protein